MGIRDVVIHGGVIFGETLWGIAVRPYETYRRIVHERHVVAIVYIAFVLACYFALASLVKTAAFRPFLLTREFIVLVTGVGMSFCLTVLLLWYVGRFMGGVGRLSTLALAWAYTLIPTVTWFFMTSLLYVIIPPPRTTSILGVVFSVLFLICSVTLLFWKLTLAYLTLRFSMRMDLAKISLTVLVVLPILALYSVIMYQRGIFKVPFL